MTTKTEQGYGSAEGESLKDKKPTTGIPQLDEMISQSSYEAQAMAYACLRASWVNNELGDKIQALLESHIMPLTRPHADEGVDGFDYQCGIAPVKEWLAFFHGVEAGSEDNEPSEPTEGTEQTDNLPTIAANWLRRQPYTTKLAIMCAWELCRCEGSEGFPKRIGNEVYQDCKQVIQQAAHDTKYLKDGDPLEKAITVFTATLIPMPI